MKASLFVQVMFVGLLTAGLQSRSANAQGLNVNFDYATFRYDSLQTFAEFYYSFNSSSLRFAKIARKDSTGSFMFSDTLFFAISLKQANGDSTAINQDWKVPVTVPDTTPGYVRKSLVGKLDFALPPGNYKLYAKTEDVNNPSNIDSLRGDFPVPAYGGDKFESSEIELCSTIDQSQTPGIFYKNTYNVVPNPSALYGLGMPIIYYYLEIYNIPLASGDTSITAGYEIRDSYGQVKKSYYLTRKKFGTSSVEVGTVNGSNLRTGAYTITYQVVDSGANVQTSSSKKFFVYNPNLGTPAVPDSNFSSGAILSSVYSSMGEAQLDKEFAETRYISTPMERDQYEQLNGTGPKRQFMYEFWNKRNSDATEKVNDTRSQYLERVSYADDNFRSGMKEGWQTDRGRVYIMYGSPDEIDRHPNETDSKPYEIWYYNALEGGVSFDFVDRTGFGEYTLVNSTKRNEIQDQNWQEYLTR